MSRFWLQYYPAGVPADIDPLACRRSKHSRDACERYADRIAYRSMARRSPIGSWRSARAPSARGCSTAPGLVSGDRVAIMLPNVLQYPIAMFGALRAGSWWSTSIRSTRRPSSSTS